MEAGVDRELYISIREEYQEFPEALGLLNKAIYGLVQVRRCWNSKFCDDMTAVEFEQSKTDPCVFREVDDGEVEMVVVVRMDEIFAHVKHQSVMKRFTAELGRKFENISDAKYYRRVPTLSKSGGMANLGEEGIAKN